MPVIVNFARDAALPGCYPTLRNYKDVSNRIYRARGPVALVVTSLLGIGLVLVATSRYGVGLSPDSAYYIFAARSLLSGKGYLDFDGTLYTNWPPLFPTLLAGLGLVGIEPLDGARLLNAVTFGLIVLASGKLFIRCIRSKAFAVLGILSVLLSFQLLKVSVMAWSEPVFILLVLFFIMYMPSFLKSRSWSSLVWSRLSLHLLAFNDTQVSPWYWPEVFS